MGLKYEILNMMCVIGIVFFIIVGALFIQNCADESPIPQSAMDDIKEWSKKDGEIAKKSKEFAKDDKISHAEYWQLHRMQEKSVHKQSLKELRGN